ncbi:MAG: hypothetical protein QOD06_732 [Candidatus Binatota bacterium]|nr:hypothetical protein [Candidatus Binatota bacterium]
MVEGYADREPAISAVDGLQGIARRGREGEVTRFLVANDVDELGLPDAAATLFRSIPGHDRFAGAAFLGTLRALEAAGRRRSMLEAARSAPWETLEDEDFAEAAYRVARAALVEGRTADARSWAESVPDGSEFHPYARMLAMQAASAAGRDELALEAARALFGSRGSTVLRERAALSLGELLIDAGRYAEAERLLAWPAIGPFAPAAGRAGGVAISLAAIEDGRLDTADESAAAVEHSLRDLAAEVEASVGTPDARAARTAALRRVWPPRALVRSRRQWAARHAARAAAETGSWFTTLTRVLWHSLPPVALWNLATAPAAARPGDAGTNDAALGRGDRFFFAPDPAVARALAALALAGQGPASEPCEARALRATAAASLLGERPPPDPPELARLASGCARTSSAGLASRARAALDHALEESARRSARRLREQAYRVVRAVAEARVRAGERGAVGAGLR